MDGNRRWAKKRGLRAKEGHIEGQKALKKIVKYCGKIKLKYLTVFAFSTENFFRGKAEIRALFKLMERSLDEETPELDENNVRLKFIGKLDELPASFRQKIKESEEKLSRNTGLNLIVAVNYGSRSEITEACKGTDNLTERSISENLYTNKIPDPDLLIRTGGVFRLSNFLLWQIAYSELFFIKTLWPDFKENHLRKAILDYNKRERRFGK